MKIGIMSDTHDNIPKIKSAVEIFRKRGVALVIHAGDYVAPFAANPFRELGCKLVGVFGNNDGERLGLKARFAEVGEIVGDSAIIEIGGKNIAVIHKDELVDSIAGAIKHDVVVYGHTHEVDVRTVGNTLVVNPGEVGGWLTGRSTIAIIDLDSMKPEIIDI